MMLRLEHIPSIKEMLKYSDKKVDEETVSTLIAMLQKTECAKLSSVKILKTGVVVKAGSIESVTCKIQSTVVDERIPIVFEPEISEVLPEGVEFHTSLLHLKKGNNTRITISVINRSTRDIKLNGRIEIGEINLVDSVTPVQVQQMERKEENLKNVQVSSLRLEENDGASLDEVLLDGASLDVLGSNSSSTQIQNDNKSMSMEEPSDGQSSNEIHDEEHDQLYWNEIMKVDMSMLTQEETKRARKLLWEERSSFAVDMNDIGCAQELELDINTNDENPVQQRYNSVPRPLMDEVKCHIEDLLNRQWITKSRSAWSSHGTGS